MKIDRTKLRKSSSELPSDCKYLIDQLKSCSNGELLATLSKIKTWNYGKCELYHWIDVLDMFDSILESAVTKSSDRQWILKCDLPGHDENKKLLLEILQFTALLIEHSFSRHLYNSMDHLTSLLSSEDLNVVLAVLNLLYVFSKRSNFITRLAGEKRQSLISRLIYVAESWGGKENGFGLSECCQDLPLSKFPSSATTLHFEYYSDFTEEKIKGSSNQSSGKKSAGYGSNAVHSIHMANLDRAKEKSASAIMESILNHYNVPVEKRPLLFTHVRLAHAFASFPKRLLCVQSRLQALSIVVYSNALQDSVNSLLYTGLIEELVDVLELKDERLMEIKAASLRTLTSIIHLDRNPKLNSIIDSTGAASYHGFLPVLVRSSIQSLTDNDGTSVPLPFATALFSFLYHLASYENGGEALVSCGMMECLLRVVNWQGIEPENITFVTRAVRVIDLITNLDMQAFQAHSVLNIFVHRLEVEVDICRKERPFVISVNADSSASTSMDFQDGNVSSEISQLQQEESFNATSSEIATNGAQQCLPQRAALLKSMLNFLKKAIQDSAFSDSIRQVMDGSLPRSLKHIISNAEYYGPSLFLLATDVVTVYVFQEPSLLSSLQDNGLTDVVLHALLVKDVPATREVLGSLPNVFSALCLNARGLQSFVHCKPFERLFKVLLSPVYLPAMRRRRSSDPMGDTATNLGNAMDELMRHQPSLKTSAMTAIFQLLEEVCAMGSDPKYTCLRPAAKNEISSTVTTGRNVGAGTSGTAAAADSGSSDEEEDDDDLSSTGSALKQTAANGTSSETENSAINANAASTSSASAQENVDDKVPIPLMDYILNVMKFVDAILSNNSTDDHCREFVSQKGLGPLMQILGLANLPIDFPVTPSCQSVASVCKTILNLAHEPLVLKLGLLHLNIVLEALEPLHCPLETPGGSVLLNELANAASLSDAVGNPRATPLLHSMAAAHAYIMMFVQVCRTGQSDVRTISVSHWGSELGLTVLKGLSRLYTSLVWESTVLLTLCSDDSLPPGCMFGKADMDKLIPKELRNIDDVSTLIRSVGEMGSNGVTTAMEALSTDSNTMEVDEPTKSPSADGLAATPTTKPKLSLGLQAQIKHIKPLLSSSSRLGRALAEFFGLLVKLCVGSPVRQRRGLPAPINPVLPSSPARAVACALTKLLSDGLSWEPPSSSPVPKFRLTFFICSVGFTSPLLFDEKKFPYHLMLQKFLSLGGLNAFFDAFRWALSCGGSVSIEEGLEHPSLPDGTGEFLDSWLLLLEKLVNPKTILESPHTLPTKPTQTFVPFNPVLYLIHVHKRAFQAVMYLWDKKPLKVYGGRMSESILTILCHILRSEVIIKDYQKDRETSEPSGSSGIKTSVARNLASSSNLSTLVSAAVDASASSSATTSGTSITAVAASSSGNIASSNLDDDINPDHLQQLMDMGFTREAATGALLHTNSIEHATDFLLNCNNTTVRGSQSALSELDLSEEDQMMRAIAMSLGENVMSTDSKGPNEEKSEETEAERDKQADEEPLSLEALDEFARCMMPGFLRLLDALPECVYRLCDLLVAVIQRNGEKWRDDCLQSLVSQILENALKLTEDCKPLVTSDTRTVTEWALNLSTSGEAGKTAARVHLFTLLFEETRIPCARFSEKNGLLDILVHLLENAQNCLSAAASARSSNVSPQGENWSQPLPTPKWLAPLLLLIDLYEKVSVSTKRKAAMSKVTSHVWKWFDDRSGKWCLYNAVSNKVIDDAYEAGESSARFNAGRRRYTVQFATMVQINEETGNRRPIMLSLKAKEEKKEESTSVEKDETEIQKIRNQDNMETDDQVGSSDKRYLEINGLSLEQQATIVRSCVGLIAIPVDADTLHAVMRLCLRLTRNHQMALIFAELGGPRLLLRLTRVSAFTGFTSLATLLVRHVMEEQRTLLHTMEKVIRSTTYSSSSTVGSKELHYLLRVLAPAACRAPEQFVEVACNILRVALPTSTLKRGEEEESRLTGTLGVQLLKALPAKATVVPVLEGPIREVICDLLDALAIKTLPTEPIASTVEHSATVERLPSADGLRLVFTNRRELSRNGSTSDLLQHEDVEPVVADDTPSTTNSSGNIPTVIRNAAAVNVTPTAVAPATPLPKTPAELEAADLSRPALPKSAVCRLLAELVRSYAGCARLVAEYTYKAGQSELITEDCTALSFILDRLVPQCHNEGDKDTLALSRMLIAALASCNHSPEAQTALVSEVKAALNRALSMPEGTEKHNCIQSLTYLVCTMIESCPTTSPVQPTTGGITSNAYKHQNLGMNNIIRFLIKKNVMQDLARVPHCLDLSSPNMAATVNAALKPLETLSRSVNQPTTVISRPGLTNKSNRLSIGGSNSINNISGVAEQGNQTSTPLSEAVEQQITSRSADDGPMDVTELVDEEPNTAPTVTTSSTSEATNAILEATTEDITDNTDNDNLALDTTGPPDGLENTVGEQHETELDDLIGRLRETNDSQVLAETILVETCAPRRRHPRHHHRHSHQRTHHHHHSQRTSRSGNRNSGHRRRLESDDGRNSSQEIIISVETEDFDPPDAQLIQSSRHDSVFDNQCSSESDSDSDTEPSDDDDDEEEEEERDDEHEEEDEDEGDENEEEDEEDDDDDEEFDADEDIHDFEDSLFRFNERGDDLFIRLDGASSFVLGTPMIRTLFPGPMMDDIVNSNEHTGPAIPPAPGLVAGTHPLLVRHQDSQSSFLARLHRTDRTRGGSYRFTAPSSSHGWHIYAGVGGTGGTAGGSGTGGGGGGTSGGVLNTTIMGLTGGGASTLGTGISSASGLLAAYGGAGRHSNPPAILQRLLGPTAHDVLQLTSGLHGQASTSSQARVLVSNDDLRIVTDVDLVEIQDSNTLCGCSPSGSLANIPSALVRWTEESQVLDSDSVHDCVTAIKPIIVETLEKHRDIELNERREKRKALQAAEEEAEKMKAEILAAEKKDEIQTVSSIAEAAAVESAITVTENLNNFESSTSEKIVNEQTGRSSLAVESSSSTPAEAVTSVDEMPSTTSTADLVATDQTARYGADQPLQTTTSLTPTSSSPSSWFNSPSSSSTTSSSSSIASSSNASSSVRAAFSSALAAITSISTAAPDSPMDYVTSGTDGRTVSSAVSGETVSQINNQQSTELSIQQNQTNEETSDNSKSEEESGRDKPAEQEANEASETLGQMEASTPVSESSAVTPSTEEALPATAPAPSTELEIPEGVDPSFLAALPANIRQEVVAEQLRLQRIRQRAQAQASEAQAAGFTEVNPDFLAALPPHIQEEVLAQQRQEQQRLASQNVNPDAPVDPSSFIQTLPPTLRQQVLADMDDTVLAVLPPDLAAEAQSLRRELEAHHRQMQERLFGHGTALSNIIRNTGRLSSARYTIHADGSHRGHWPFSGSLSSRTGSGLGTLSGADGRTNLPGGASLRLRGRQLLDHEALTCLLVLLFVDEPKLNTGRLHRVLRNLCYHTATREWVIKSLLSILDKTGECRLNSNYYSPNETSQSPDVQPSKRAKKNSSAASSGTGSSGQQIAMDPVLGLHRVSVSRSQPSWLSISMDAALGCRANVFQIHHRHTSSHCPSGLPATQSPLSSGGVTSVIPPPLASSEKKDKKSNATVHCPVYVHSQAAPVVCRHVLDTLISLAKCFPSYFVPGKVKEIPAESLICSLNKISNIASPSTSTTPQSASQATPNATLAVPGTSRDTDFWDLLVRLDSATTPGRKGSGSGTSGRSMTTRLTHSSTEDEQSALNSVSMETTGPGAASFESSPLGHLVAMLSHPIVKKSSALTDRLLRLLALVSIGLNDSGSNVQPATASNIRQSATTSNALNSNSAFIESDSSSFIKLHEDPVLEQHLKLAVEVLTSKSCSEEGLEDATAFLLQLSRGNPVVCETVLRLLLGGSRKLGMFVCTHIAALMQDLRELNNKQKVKIPEDDASDDSGSSSRSVHRGTVSDRFTRDVVVLTAANRAQAGRELHLPSMALLTSKTSSQAFFLRILKVIVHLRDAIKVSNKKKGAAAQSSSNAPSTSSANQSEAAETATLTTATTTVTTTTAATTTAATTTAATTTASVSVSGAPGTSSSRPGTPMEVDVSSPSSSAAQTPSRAIRTIADTISVAINIALAETDKVEIKLPRLSEQLQLDELWETLSECLKELADTSDHHAVLVLQPAVEAFFLVHAAASDTEKVRHRKQQAESRESQLSHIHLDMAPLSPLQPGEDTGNSGIDDSSQNLSVAKLNSSVNSQTPPPASPDMEKFLTFAETHRTVLNQILRQSTVHLAEGPFAMLVDHTRILDFDIKRRYFRQELDRLDEGIRREDLAVHVRREHVFEDSFRELHRRTAEEWKNRFYIVFEGEEGQDAGGLLREWYTIISREIFNPMYALFTTSPGDRVTYMINSSSHCNSNHLSYFKFVGHVIAKAIYDNKLLDCYFTRSFYKHILGKLVKYTDMESEDYAFYQGLVFLLEHDIKELDYELTYSTEVQEFGVTEARDLKPNGRNIVVNEENKQEYVRLVCQMKMTGAIRKQLNAFLEGFYDIIPKRLISIFNEQELELLISGLPVVDIDDLKANTEYYKYQITSLQIQWFWRALRSFDQADRAKFLQFVTGTSKVPLQGFAALEGMSGTQKFQIHRDDRSTDRLPSAHTCFNQLDLPAYETFDKLCTMLLKAVHECSEGFGFA